MQAGIWPSVAKFFFFCITFQSTYGAQYRGKFLGKLSELHHGVSGEVYAVDSRTLHLKDFTYDGQGPAAYFFAGNSRNPNKSGFRVRDENGNGEVIRRYRKESVTLTLPDGKNLNSVKWFSIWCEEYEINFGDVKIPRSFDYPRPQKIDALRGVHGISSDNIVIVDAQTLLIPNLSYDGEAPDAKFWVGRGPKPSPQGIRVSDENGKEAPLRKYDRKTVVLTLPSDLTVFDIGHFGIWCEAFTVDFGHVQIPQTLNVPPSLKMLGVSPQSKLNCEVLYDDLAFEVRWAVAGDSIVLQLVAKLDEREYMSFGVSGDDTRSEMVGADVVVAWVDKETLKGFAEDYFLDAKSQCSGPRGSCPDERITENTNSIRLLNAAMVNGYSIVTYQRPLKASDELDRKIYTNQSQAVIWAIGPLNQRDEVSFHSQYTKTDKLIDFGRPAKWNCPMPEGDNPSMKAVAAQSKQREVYKPTEEPQELEEEPTTTIRSRTSERRRGSTRQESIEVTREPERTRGSSRQEVTERTRDVQRTRGRQTQRRGSSRITETTTESKPRPVPTPAPVSKRDAWKIPAVQCHEPEDGVFYAQMGPTGGKKGYPAITGHVGWGTSWYINGLLIPEINVVRGKTYTFVVEGGHDPDVPAKFHPFYITDDPVGGYQYKTAEEQRNIHIYAGAVVSKDGDIEPTGIGRLCHWTHQGDSDADDFESFGAYQRTLELKCDRGEPGVIQWTPDNDTPDTVYYQCFTHRYLGWKINVLDSCDIQVAGSEPEPAYALPDSQADDLEDSPSIQVEVRVKPNDIIGQNLNKSEISDKLDLNDTEAAKRAEIDNQEGTTKVVITPPYDGTLSQDTITQVPPIVPPANYYRFPFYLPEAPLYQPNYEPIFYAPDVPFKFENPQTFKPSLPMDYVEDAKVEEKSSLENSSDSHTSSSDELKVVEKTTEPTEMKETTSNQTYIILPSTRLPMFGPIKMRRPISQFQARSPLIMKPYQRPIAIAKRPMLPPYKKSIFRTPLVKGPMYKPMKIKYEQKPLMLQSSHRTPVFIMKRPQHLKPTFIVKTTEMTKLKPYVEISQMQASTEKEPEITKQRPYAPLISIFPQKEPYREFKGTLHPAINTGFRPESVIIEGGFKPIISKGIEDRMDEEQGPELEYESEIGVINVEGTKSEHKPIATFEPMFIPSPLDNPTKNKTQPLKIHMRRFNQKKAPIMFILKKGRSDDEDEVIAEAAERVESYYLPPVDKKIRPSEPKQPSNIDIPPGTVVAYDGKKLSGASLTARFDLINLYEGRGSKASELVRARPQFVPFKGDLPPLDPENINRNLPQLQSRGFLNRDLDAPAEGGTTRLTLVKQVEAEEDEEVGEGRTKREIRNKREAHHTPEHTAEQRWDGNQTEPNSAPLKRISNFTYLLAIILVLRF